MKCTSCEEKAISTQPTLCKKHFDEYILKTVEDTIKKFELFTKQTKILVAVSGGKDSLALADILLRLGYSVTGLFIDEGINNYREHSKEDLSLFEKEKNFTVLRKSFKEEFGFTLDEAIQTKLYHACTICGTLRRYLLNKYARQHEVIATGHNLDDESQTILMNLARGNTELFLRLGPKSTEKNEFTQRVKPFYYLTEKQILTYTILRKIRVQYGECPYAFTSYRAQLRDLLNKKESKEPGTKKKIVETYLKIKKENEDYDLQLKILSRPSPLQPIRQCKICGEPSQKEICKTCMIVEEIKKKIK